MPRSSKVMARQAVMLNRVEEKLPSASDVAKVDNTELQEITENAVRSMEDLIAQFEDPPVDHPPSEHRWNILCVSFRARTRS